MTSIDERSDLQQQADTVLAQEREETDVPAEVRVHEDHTRELVTPGFSRMRTEWTGPEGSILSSLKSVADGEILRLFPDAYSIMHDLWLLVREPEVDRHTGEIYLDQWDLPVWKRNESGAYIEDYSLLGHRERDDFLFRITTAVFTWEQQAADLWGNAMFAKAIWEETFATGYIGASGRTIDDRTNAARLAAVDQRYFSIFQTLLSRRADAVVASLKLVGQRLKDSLI